MSNNKYRTCRIVKLPVGEGNKFRELYKDYCGFISVEHHEGFDECWIRCSKAEFNQIKEDLDLVLVRNKIDIKFNYWMYRKKKRKAA